MRLDVDLRTRRASAGVSSWVVEHTVPGEAEPFLRVARLDGGYLVVHARGLEVEVHGVNVVVTHVDPALCAEDLEHLLVDQLLPLVMSRMGRLSLHGSAVAWGGRGLALLGRSGAGKSTTATAAVVRLGAELIADDQVVIEPRGAEHLVHAGYASTRLWGDAARAFGAPRATAAHEVERKERVALRAVRSPVVLAVLAVLERGDEPRWTTLRPRDAVTQIAVHVDRLDPTDRSALRAELELLAVLASRVHVVKLELPDGLERVAPALDAFRVAVRI